ncbi:MAG: hypothetical protein K1060chlam2_00218 [Chlamydiae bacterium]|nr:hypothetical protein [Chlamydiota bacterium]
MDFFVPLWLECRNTQVGLLMKRFYTSIFFLSTIFFPLMAEHPYAPSSFMNSSSSLQKEPQLLINNRPLAKINGRVISLFDVIKQMDLFLFEYSPEFSPSVVEKYQYYSSRWESTLDDMIADELILLDAEEKEVKISDGAVREELWRRFGPNIRESLDRVSLEYEEARDIIRSDLTVGQLLGMKVHAKAYQLVTPELIIEAYDEYIVENPPKEEWKYQVLSIRGRDKERCETLSKKAHELLQEKRESLETVVASLKEEGITVSVSEEYSGHSEKFSKLHFDVIKALSPDTISQPVSQVSKFDNTTVFRIFHLKDLIKTLPSQFAEMHDKLRNELLYERSDFEKVSYINMLKKRFSYSKFDPKFALPENYHPFLVI